LAVANVASAVSFTAVQTKTFNSTGSQNLSFDGFDSGLGTLTSVHLSWTYNYDLTDQAAVQAPFTTNIDVGDPVPLTATATIIISGPSYNFLTSHTTPGYTGQVFWPGINDLGNVAGTNSLPDTDIFNGNAALWTGGANFVTFNFNSIGSQGGTVPGDSSVFTGNQLFIDGSVSLYYDYDDGITNAPEIDAMAGTGALSLLAGALALAGERRRRRA
jgi:hypothetical protein